MKTASLKFSVILFFAVFSFLKTAAQPDGRTNFDGSNTGKIIASENDTLPPEVQTVAVNRNNTLYFFNSMLNLSDPTTVSTGLPWGLLDRTFNLEKALQKKPYVLHADVCPPIALGGKRWYQPKTGILTALHLTPGYRVRILQNDPAKGDRSFPVRTPSFMPSITVFLSHKTLWRDTNVNNHYLSIRAFHHSDGQDGPLIDSTTMKFNTYNGDFGDNLILEIGYGGQYNEKYRPKDPKQVRTWLERKEISSKRDFYFWKASQEIRFKNTGNQWLERQRIYGKHRTNIVLGWYKCATVRQMFKPKNTEKWYPVEEYHHVERIRMTLHTSYIWDVPYRSGRIDNLQKVPFFNAKKRLNITFTAYRRLWGTPYSMVFAQVGYFGSDPYNVYFQQSMFFYRAGIAAGFFAYDLNKDRVK